MLTFQVEQWEQALPELLPMFSRLFEDVGVDKDRFTAKCDTAKYKALSEAGAICLTTARLDGKLIGYYAALIIANPHYEGQGLMAYTDMYFVEPELRKGTLGVQLFQFSEQEWRKRGAVKAYSSHKIHRDRSKMFQVLGWKPLDIVYSKVLT